MNANNDQFEKLVSEYYELLFRFAMNLTRTESEAWDLTQQTFYIWATKGHQLRDLTKVKTWLFTTLHRVFLATRRRHNRFYHYDLEAAVDQLPCIPAEVIDQADCSEVIKALAKVDENFKAAVALYYLDDCSYKEIAEILDVPIGTVKSRIARGITQLRKILLSNDVFDATFRPDKHFAVSDDDQSSASHEEILDEQPSEIAPNTGDPEKFHSQWDLSASARREQFCLF